MRTIRTAARALIIQDDKVLTIKMQDTSGIFYILPGGGQQHGETLIEGLQRECLEEIGSSVNVGDIAYVREYIGKNHEFRQSHGNFHQLESVFFCELTAPGGCRSRNCIGQQTNWHRMDTSFRITPAEIPPAGHQIRVLKNRLSVGHNLSGGY